MSGNTIQEFSPADGERSAVDSGGSLEVIWSLSSQLRLHIGLSRELFKDSQAQPALLEALILLVWGGAQVSLIS